MKQWKEPTKRQKADWEGKMLLDIVDIATAIIRLADSIAVSVCKITELRDGLIVRLTGAAPEQRPAAIKAWQEMAALKYREDWPKYDGSPIVASEPEPVQRKRKRKKK